MPERKSRRFARPAGEREFIAMMALVTSMVALSIDAMLPALGAIAADLGAASPNDRQWVISALFLGFGVAQTIYGPVSDSVGRRPVIFFGFAVFLVGCVISLTASDFESMLLGRFVQGFGAAAPRTVSMAVVRDRCSGDEMARVMSLIMAAFIFVPAIAPAIGQVILLIADWRAIFHVFIVLALIAVAWFGLRQPETLPRERRSGLRPAVLWRALREVLGNRFAIGYTAASGLAFGCLLSYLGTAQQIMQELYATGTLFPLYFAALALAIGAASLVNARLVRRLGMHRLFAGGQRALCALSAGFLLITLLYDGLPPLWAFMAYMLPAFFAIGLLFGNGNALAMEPLGHIAGMAAAVIGSLMTLISVLLGALVGQLYDATVVPLVAAFAVFSLLGALLVARLDRVRAAVSG